MTIFIAEIGLNYEGTPTIALELIRQAALAGADVAKFQFGWRADVGEINHITPEFAGSLKNACENAGLEMMASILNDEALSLARDLELPRYKIASRTVRDDPGLCERILSEGKPTIVSLGMWEADDWPFGPPRQGQLSYLYCRSIYPTAPRDLADMPERFSSDGYLGYSDHHLGISACLIALARGAQLIEKHFTLNKASTSIRDHVLSATPSEFSELTRLGREIARNARAIQN